MSMALMCVFFLFLWLSPCDARYMIRPELMESYNTIEYVDTSPYSNAFSGMVKFTTWHVPIPVYSLNRARIGLKESVLVECFNYTTTCDEYIPSERDVKLLSLYASMIESSNYKMPHHYSIGIIRDHAKAYTKGMYTQSGEFIAFWIRLHDLDGMDLYTYKDKWKMTLSMLELSVHERSHYDSIVTYNSNLGHCDSYQRIYNTLIERAIDNIYSYEKLTDFIVYDGYSQFLLLLPFALLPVVLWMCVDG